MPTYLTDAPLIEMTTETELTDVFVFVADPALTENTDENDASSEDTADLADNGGVFRNGYLFLRDPDLTGSALPQPVLESAQDPVQIGAVSLLDDDVDLIL